MHNFILSQGIQFTPEEKQRCIPTVHRIVNLINLAWKNGILYLEVEVFEENNTFMKIGVDLLCNGVTPDLMEKILCSYIAYGNYKGYELLEKLIITQGLLAIYQSYNPYVIVHIMASMLGEEYLPEILSTVNSTINLNTCINEHTFYLPESAEFEKELLKLTRLELSRVLMPLDYEVFGIAFQGCSKSFINQMRDGVSVNFFNQICSVFMQQLFIKEDILAHQKIILKTMER